MAEPDTRYGGTFPPPLEIPPDAFEAIRRIVKERRGFSIDGYKDKCIKRRIAIRVRATHSRSAEEYGALLAGDEGEIDRLLKVLTIHVSQFFRNLPTFDKLRQEVFPYLFSRHGEKGFTIWSVGCASGEEPYTAAIILSHYFPEELASCPVSIFATDVDAGILELARRGVYGEERLTEVPEEIRRRYFIREGGKYHLRDAIRQLVTFRQEDLFSHRPYPPSDLILCRNVLIYFERRQQEQILTGFAGSLRRDGILVLGKSETLVGESRRRFVTICPVERIYRVL